MRIAFFSPVQLPAQAAPAKKQRDFELESEEEECISEATSHYTTDAEGDSTSVDDASLDALAEELETPLPELDSKDLKMLLLSPLEPEIDF